MAVVLGSEPRLVPDDAARVPFVLTPGTQARIVEDAGDWLFLDFGDGRAAWLRAGGVERY